MIQKLKNRFKKKTRYLHKNIDFLLQKFSIDIKTLSIETDIPIATLFRMKNEENNPTLSTLEPISEFFRIDLNDLLYTELFSEEYQNKSKIGQIQYIPTIDLETIKSWPINLDKKIYFGTIGNLHKDSFGIRINSNSMAPIFYNNSIAIIDPEISPKDSDYVFCLIGTDKIPLLRQIFIDGNNYYFKPINPNYGEIVCTKKYKIIGIVVKSIENYR